MHDIADEPAFAWWIRHTLKKRDHIISKTVSRYWQRTRKYSIDIPKSVDYGIRIDRKNKNIFWWDVIQLEMLNVRPAVEIHEEEKSDTPIGYTNRIPRDSLPYNLRCEAGVNFRRKARLVGGRYKTKAPSCITYSSVASRDSVCIALTVEALIDLDILACNIKNAYFTVKCQKKIWTVAGK